MTSSSSEIGWSNGAYALLMIQLMCEFGNRSRSAARIGNVWTTSPSALGLMSAIRRALNVGEGRTIGSTIARDVKLGKTIRRIEGKSARHGRLGEFAGCSGRETANFTNVKALVHTFDGSLDKTAYGFT